jgi:predicted nucleic acid-binding protein
LKARVFVDAGPLIALSKIDALGLLPALFGELDTSTQVRSELLGESKYQGSDALKSAFNQGWLRVHDADLAQ